MKLRTTPSIYSQRHDRFIQNINDPRHGGTRGHVDFNRTKRHQAENGKYKKWIAPERGDRTLRDERGDRTLRDVRASPSRIGQGIFAEPERRASPLRESDLRREDDVRASSSHQPTYSRPSRRDDGQTSFATEVPIIHTNDAVNTRPDGTLQEEQCELKEFQLDTQTHLALRKISLHMNNQIAKSNWILQTNIAGVDKQVRQWMNILEECKHEFHQRNYLLEDELRNIKHARKNDAIMLDAALMEHEKRTVDVVAPLVESRMASSLHDLQCEIAYMRDSMKETCEVVRELEAKGPDQGNVEMAMQIAKYVSTQMKTNLHATTCNSEYFDNKGNVKDESAFVRDLENSLTNAIASFLPCASHLSDNVVQET